jgi:hypothetical protein
MSARGDNDSKLLFSTAGVDLSDDASIDAFAVRVWETAVMSRTGDDVSSELQEDPKARVPSVVLTDKYTAAVAYASAIHAIGVRKGTDTTYLCHLLGVSALALEAGGSEDEAIAGLLHDAIEDAGGMPREKDVRARFGDTVADIVLACSDSTDEIWKSEVDYWTRKQKYLDHLEDPATDPRAVMVSIADKVHNARATVTDLERTGVDVLEKFNAPDRALVGKYYTELRRIAQLKEVPDTLTIPLGIAVDTITGFINSGVPGRP